MKGRQKGILLLFAAAVVIIAVLYVGSQTIRRDEGDGGSTSPAKEEETMTIEEQKEQVEAQTGVTVKEDNTMTVDVGAIMEEEESMPVSRQEAQTAIVKRVGEGAEVTSMQLREDGGKKYWAAKVKKEKETYLVWISADTGEEYIFQKSAEER